MQQAWLWIKGLMRLDRPVGVGLLAWPAMWGLLMASPHGVPWSWFVLFALGVFLMRSAGCALNDWADRRWDGAVSRTRHRPLPAGQCVGWQALVLASTLALMAAWLTLWGPPWFQWLAVIGAGMAGLYPFMKRWCDLPQLFLGWAFTWGFPMAFAAVQGQVPRLVWVGWMLMWLWPLAYDTLYAMVDAADDRLAGIRSTALWWGSYAWPVVFGCYIVWFAGSWWLAWRMGWSLASAAWGGLVQTAWLVALVVAWRRGTPEACFQAFRWNVPLGAALAWVVVVGVHGANLTLGAVV